MADPATLAMMAAVASAATTITSGFAAKGQADFNADVADNNAKLARQRSAAQGAERARRTRMALSRQRASAAARGVQFSGSALDVAGEEAIESELEQRFIAHRGTVEAQGLRAQAKLQRTQGKFALGSSFVQAGGQLLQGGADFQTAQAARSPSTGTT